MNITYISLTGIAIYHLVGQEYRKSPEPVSILQSNQFLPEIAIIVPAYNEERVIVQSVTSLLSLVYPNYEIIIVNDGSTDQTVERLKSHFDLKRINAEYPIDLNCEPLRNIYRSVNHDIVLIDKLNGGKADALNAGVYFADSPLFCAIDADSLIQRGALREVVEPFLTNPIKTVATGGNIRIANGVRIRNCEARQIDLPSNRLVRFQVVEYLRAFFIGRIGLSRLESLIIISGAFGLFKTDIVREIGGYDTDSVTEDFEMVVRMHRHLIESGRDYDVTFLHNPIVWTQVPESLHILSQQRRRWFRGLLDTIIKHRDALGRPSYGMVGIFALPFFLGSEAFGRMLEWIGYLLIPILFFMGFLDIRFFTSFLLVSVGLGTVLTALAVFGEVITYRGHDEPRDIGILLIYSILENILFRPWRAFISWRGTFEYLIGDKSWGKMRRVGFNE